MNKIVQVKLGDFYKRYDFFATEDLELHVGDKVVVDTVNGLVLGEVKGFKARSKFANNFIVCKVDVAAHEEKLEKYNRVKGIRDTIARLQAELDGCYIELESMGVEY